MKIIRKQMRELMIAEMWVCFSFVRSFSTQNAKHKIAEIIINKLYERKNAAELIEKFKLKLLSLCLWISTNKVNDLQQKLQLSTSELQKSSQSHGGEHA
jgi:hypothetical protein